MFEALVERDLKIYADSFYGKCYHYQDYQEKEIDSIIELEDGRWCAFEIKLGANQIEKAANDLLNLKKQIEKENGYKLDITDTRLHHEIYLSDPRKCDVSKLKTVIRHPIKKIK